MFESSPGHHKISKLAQAGFFYGAEQATCSRLCDRFLFAFSSRMKKKTVTTGLPDFFLIVFRFPFFQQQGIANDRH